MVSTYSPQRTQVYRPRYRRDCLGELVQNDSSHPNRFEDRTPKCCILAFMDDATERMIQLRFYDSENAFDYMMRTWQCIEIHGDFFSFYCGLT